MPLTNILLIASILLTLIVVILVLTRKSGNQSAETLHAGLSAFSAELNKIAPLLRDEFARNREENQRMSRDARQEGSQSFKLFSETQTQSFQTLLTHQTKAALESRTELAASLRFFEEKTGNNLEKIRETVETKLRSLQEENAKKLDEMRSTVDEKLQATVEKRFSDSFKLISDRLEQVHKGLGEMQTLASGVGDLKKVLTNVKTRGNLGEIQLGAILEEIFSPDQYDKNAVVKPGSQERVEYAIKLPGRNADNRSLLLPVDSKFPNEDYQRLMEAYENIANLDPKFVDNISNQFENAVRKCGKEIREKYINPPVTTDFAIMFVPTEGLYAEILRRAGLFETLRRDFKVTVVGPTNLVAFLNSLQMGFRTLAIEKRSSEVWEILGAVKTEFSNFSIVLEKTKKKLQEATNSIDKAGVRTRAIERQLRKVQELPQDQAVSLIGQTLDMESEQILDEEKDNEED